MRVKIMHLLLQLLAVLTGCNYCVTNFMLTQEVETTASIGQILRIFQPCLTTLNLISTSLAQSLLTVESIRLLKHVTLNSYRNVLSMVSLNSKSSDVTSVKSIYLLLTKSYS